MIEPLADLLRAGMAKAKIPGASLAIRKNGHTALATGGVLHLTQRTPVTPDAAFQIGSITKVMTTTLAIKLVDDGTLNLDTPVVEYIPGFRIAAIPEARAITMRHLLTHTSGIDGDFLPDLPSNAESYRRYVEQMSRLSALHRVGKGFSYCNAGFVLAARVIEVLTGLSWEGAIRTWLFAPLKLAGASTGPDDESAAPRAWGHVPGADAPHDPQPQAERYLVPRVLAPAGATISMSATDLMRFVELHLRSGVLDDGTRILTASAVEQMRTSQTDLPPYAALGAVGWGLGWCLYDWDGLRLFGHDGDTVGQFAFLRVDPETCTAAVLLTNGGDAQGLADTVFGTIFGKRPPPPGPPDARIPATLDLNAYTGRYRRLGRTLDVAIGDDGQLSLRLEFAPEEGPHLPAVFRLEAVDRHVFRGHSPLRTSPVHFQFGALDDHGRAGNVFSGYRLAIRQQ